MEFDIRMGLPEMEAHYQDLAARARKGTLGEDEKNYFKKLRKALKHLRHNPRHPGLKSHEIDPLSQKYGHKVFQSYLDQGEQAVRIFWAYGPNRGEITILGVEPHPESGKRGAYQRVKLSSMPDDEEA
jgi:hypothetical protein